MQVGAPSACLQCLTTGQHCHPSVSRGGHTHRGACHRCQLTKSVCRPSHGTLKPFESNVIVLNPPPPPLTGVRVIRPGETRPGYNYENAIRDLVLPPGSDEARLYELERHLITTSAFLATLDNLKACNRQEERFVDIILARIARLELPYHDLGLANTGIVSRLSLEQLTAFADAISNPHIPLYDVLSTFAQAPPGNSH